MTLSTRFETAYHCAFVRSLWYRRYSKVSNLSCKVPRAFPLACWRWRSATSPSLSAPLITPAPKPIIASAKIVTSRSFVRIFMGFASTHHRNARGLRGRSRSDPSLHAAARASLRSFLHQQERKGAASAVLAFEFDPASQGFGELLAQVQPEAGAFLAVLRPRIRHLAERREQLRLVFGADPDAGGLDADLERSLAVFLTPFRPEPDAPALREFDRVVDEID